MSSLINTIVFILMLIFGISLTASVLGFLRFNDTYRQIHIGAIIDMLVVPVFFLSIGLLFLKNHQNMLFFKMITLIFIWYVLNPISNYCIIKIIHFYSKKRILKDIIKEN